MGYFLTNAFETTEKNKPLSIVEQAANRQKKSVSQSDATFMDTQYFLAKRRCARICSFKRSMLSQPDDVESYLHVCNNHISCMLMKRSEKLTI